MPLVSASERTSFPSAFDLIERSAIIATMTVRHFGWPALLPELHAAVLAPNPLPALERRLARARQLMDQCETLQFDLGTLARAVRLSPFHFSREFKRTYGRTPHAYLSDLRVARARELLLETDKSVTEVAHEVGFFTNAAFTRFFAQRVGYPPSHYRKRWVVSGFIQPCPVPSCFQLAWGLAAEP